MLFSTHICTKSTLGVLLIIILYICASTLFMRLHMKVLFRPEMKRVASDSEEIFFFPKFSFDLT